MKKLTGILALVVILTSLLLFGVLDSKPLIANTTISDNHAFYVTAVPNNPPVVSFWPRPPNHATGASIYAELKWEGGDRDERDTVTYDVYFGTNSTPPLVSANQTADTYEPGTLAYNTTYYWRIVSTDNHGASTVGSIWDFTTCETAALVSISDVTTGPDGNVQVPISINNVADLGAATIFLNYNSAVVEVTSVEDGNLGGMNVTAGIWNADNQTIMAWFSVSGKTGDFVFAYVTLHAVGNAGDSSPLDLDVLYMWGPSGDLIPCSVDDGVFRISSLMEGDTTGDGYVNIVDAMFIAQYDVGLRTFTADQLTCADTTDEGTVEIVDAMHIAQWGVDPDGTSGVLHKPLWESPADDHMLPPEQ